MPTSKRGFTITEVVISICLLAVVWLAAVNIMVISAASGSLAKHKVQAQYLIQKAIEDIRKKSFSSISSYNITLKPEGAGVAPGRSEAWSLDEHGTPLYFTDDPRLGARLIVTVTTPDTYYKKVLAQVTWRESFFGRSKTVGEYAATYIARDSQAN
ncbi:MAG: hypothetical protein WC522_06845 [Candidatus Omnitrophota bacterium]